MRVFEYLSYLKQGVRTNALCPNLLSRSTIVFFKNLFLTDRSEFAVLYLCCFARYDENSLD